MLDAVKGIDIRMVAELGMPNDRPTEVKRALEVPAGTVIVSADGHFSLTEDIFYDRFPAHLKEKAPRVWRDREYGCLQVGFDGVGPFVGPAALSTASYEGVKGCYDLQARFQDLDIQGIDKEIVFPNGFLAVFLHADLDLREWIYRTYNEYMAALQHSSGGRFFPVGFVNYWDVEKTAASVAELKALGIKTVMLPINPQRNRKGNQIFYHSKEMTPMWEALEDSGLPVSFHIGENLQSGPTGVINISTLVSMSPFRRVFGEMIFGGILDRHPRLQVAFIEAGINWVASALQDAELTYASNHHLHDEEPLKKEIRSYWSEHMFSSFQTDKLGLQLLDVLGADRVIWAADYPHPEGTYGYSTTAQENVVTATSTENAVKILGGNAEKLFKL